MTRLDALRRALPAPLKAPFRAVRAAARTMRDAPSLLGVPLLAPVLTPRVLQLVPGLARRVKVADDHLVSILVTCGNRLAQLRRSLPTWLAQRFPRYEVVLSLYADREACADYIRSTCTEALAAERLRLLETAADRFNKARAVNIAAAAARGRHLLLIDVDCSFNGPRALRDMIFRANLSRAHLCSMTVWGMLLTRRDEFLTLGGFDTALSDGWAPDDFDYIARHVAHFRRLYACFAPEYRVTIDPRGDDVRITRRARRSPRWILNEGVRDAAFDIANYLHTPFYARIGGLKPSKEAYLEATIDYFRRHDPCLAFVAAPPPAADKPAPAR